MNAVALTYSKMVNELRKESIEITYADLAKKVRAQRVMVQAWDDLGNGVFGASTLTWNKRNECGSCYFEVTEVPQAHIQRLGNLVAVSF